MKALFLILEDDPMIADDLSGIIEDTFRAETIICRNPTDAAALLRKAEVDFALLDVNLGAETSFAVAETLNARATPYAFVTAQPSLIPLRLRGAPVVQKPFSQSDIVRAVVAVV